jgi:enoyl-CoA hydratase
MSDDILIARQGDVCTITLNRPDTGNAVPDSMIVELGDAFANVEPDVRVIVLRGAGHDFCVGRAPPPTKPGPMEALELRNAHDIVFRAYGLIRQAPQPVIAVVKGRALGFGFAVAAVADITIAADTAQFQIPEFAHNIMPTMVMSAIIDRVPLKALMQHVYETEPFGPERALAIGAISSIAPAGTLDEALDAMLKRMLAAPAPALFAVKEYARNAQPIDLNKAVEYARAFHAMINTSSEMRKK